ncbi:hypothetical protein GCM10010515_53160 [Streptomyces fructofermentans]|uniref:Uncharacterized protein n=1 Tax=Streptomyces fructofermentans TaxID=152141 RepID=A0A918U064_9ACTN|nr:hypothetical protein GCM10010515_53160 [Streptomyces fructofermentans]
MTGLQFASKWAAVWIANRLREEFGVVTANSSHKVKARGTECCEGVRPVSVRVNARARQAFIQLSAHRWGGICEKPVNLCGAPGN